MQSFVICRHSGGKPLIIRGQLEHGGDVLKFLGIGAQKSGTTWLYQQLRRHPQLSFPLGKEAHFWDRPRTPAAEADYLARFSDSNRIEGEITPAYAILPLETIQAIHRHAPGLRLIFMMRNPVDRAWSAALMALSRAEMTPAEASDAWFLDHFRSTASLARGDYADCICRWRSVFSAEQLLLVRYEDVLGQPETVLQRCCVHIGVTAPTARMLDECRETVFSGPGVPLPMHLRHSLEEIYRPRIAALSSLLGEDFGAWGGDVGLAARPQKTGRRSVWTRIHDLRGLRAACQKIRRSGLFDADYYLARNADVRKAGVDPVRHYLQHGAAEGRDPSPDFSTKYYLSAYPDVAAEGINPLLHYVVFGEAEGRAPKAYLAAKRPGASEPSSSPRPVSRRPDLPFKDFGGFARLSLFMPELRAPFAEGAQCVIGYFRTAHAHLRRRYSSPSATDSASVVVWSAARSEALEEAIRSVLAQDWERFEVLVVGAPGSAAIGTDRLTSIDDPRLRDLGCVEGEPFGAALNRAAASATGDFIAFLDGGARLDADFLRIMIGALRDQPQHELAYCAQAQYATGGVLSAVRYAVFQRALIENHPSIDQRCVLHRREAFVRIGGFEPRMGALAGWELLLRATESGAPLGVPCMLASVTGETARVRPADTSPDDEGCLDERRSRRRLTRQLPTARVPGIENLYGNTEAASLRGLARRKVSIIIPSFECLDYLRLCIESVQTFTAVPYELIVVDNASSSSVRSFLSDAAQSGALALIQNDHNFGFTYAVNQGIARADPEADIVLLNNDAVVTEGWIDAMQQVLHDRPDAGLVVPRQVLPPGTPTIRTHNPAMNPRREADVNLSLHHDNVIDPLLDPIRGYVELAFAPFFCVYIPRRTVQEIGLLDYESAPHYRSDRLYCDAVRHLSGRRIVYTPHSKLYHFLQRSTTELRTQDPKMFQGMFVKNEWSEVTRQAPKGVKLSKP